MNGFKFNDHPLDQKTKSNREIEKNARLMLGIGFYQFII